MPLTHAQSRPSRIVAARIPAGACGLGTPDADPPAIDPQGYAIGGSQARSFAMRRGHGGSSMIHDCTAHRKMSRTEVYSDGYTAGYNQARVDLGFMTQAEADRILQKP